MFQTCLSLRFLFMAALLFSSSQLCALQEQEKSGQFQETDGFQSAGFIKPPGNGSIFKISCRDGITRDLKIRLIQRYESSRKHRGDDVVGSEEMQTRRHEDLETDPYEEPGAAFFLELGGKPFYSVNVDFRRSKWNRLSLGIQTAEGAVLPNIMYYYLSEGGHWRCEVGGGFSVVPIKPEDWGGCWPVIIHGVLGYRYQRKNGLLFRIGFTPNVVIPEVFLPWVGISLGYSL